LFIFSQNQAVHSEEKIHEYKEAFNLFDKNGDGCISLNELGIVVRSLGMTPTEQDLRNIMHEMDINGKYNRKIRYHILGSRDLHYIFQFVHLSQVSVR
jgi:Ca2+-binding EF-hand superfamily protein